MKKELSKEELSVLRGRKVRKDLGCRHKASKHGDYRVGQYSMSGELEAEYGSLAEAVDNNDVGATYQGILACCEGRSRKHCNRFWRRSEG